MKRVLLTGAGGFVGRQCVAPLLARGFEVVAVGSRPHADQFPGVVWTRADLLDADAVNRVVARVRPTHLLHLAWCTKHGEYWNSLDNYSWVAAGIRLGLAFAEAGGVRIVGVGSCAEYDWAGGLLSEESTPCVPATPYGVCKNALRELWGSMAARLGTGFAWGRLFFLFGPGEQRGRLVPSVARPLLEGRPALCSDGGQVRDFLHVADAGDALAALLDSPVSGAVNIASGSGVAVREVARKIADRVGGSGLLRLGALPRAQNDPPLVLADVRRLESEVGWHPRFTLDAGLDHAVEWLRRHPEAGA